MFKSVATLMMTMSAILVIGLAIIILAVALYLDYLEGRLHAPYHH